MLVLATSIACAQEISYESVPNFLKPPADLHFGEVAGVAVNSKGHVFVFNRGSTVGPAYGAAAAQLLEFGPDGRYLREIGKNLYAWSYAHAVRVDKHDNIWAIDKGSDMIIRFNPAGRVTMVFGRKKEASDEAGPWTRVTPPRAPAIGQFRQPTDVTWDTEDSIFISDGYINSRVAKFDKNGDWVKSWGTPGSAAGELNTPHSIASDAAGMIAFLRALLGGELLPLDMVRAQFAELYPMFGSAESYGLGIMVYELPEGEVWLGHSGGAPGVKAVMAYSVQHDAFVAVALSGDGSAEASANLLLSQLDGTP